MRAIRLKPYAALLVILGAITWMLAESALAEDPVGKKPCVKEGDLLKIFILDEPSLSRIYGVSKDGIIRMPLFGNIGVAGLTAKQVEARLTTIIEAEYYSNPKVKVRHLKK